MRGVTPSVQPAIQKNTAPDPRLARLAEKIEQVRHARALRFPPASKRRDALH